MTMSLVVSLIPIVTVTLPAEPPDPVAVQMSISFLFGEPTDSVFTEVAAALKQVHVTLDALAPPLWDPLS